MENNIIIYQTADGETAIDVKLEKETVWLTQAQMATLFERDRTVITRHINNCFREGELDPNITCAKFAHMGSEGDQTYETVMYNLDVIISVGYRVKSKRGTQFRIWANKVLKEYLIKGYAINKSLKAERYDELKEVVRRWHAPSACRTRSRRMNMAACSMLSVTMCMHSTPSTATIIRLSPSTRPHAKNLSVPLTRMRWKPFTPKGQVWREPMVCQRKG